MSPTARGPLRSIQIFDTTLRDGELTPGVNFCQAAKLEIAQRLAAHGVEVIELAAARGAASLEDVGELTTALPLHVRVAVLCRSEDAEVDAALHALPPERGVVHLYAGGKNQQTEHTIQQATRAVRRALQAGVCVQFTPLDATRLEQSFLDDLSVAVADAGASVLSLADTLGTALPGDIAELFARHTQRLPNVRWSFHGHDDLGLATANALSAIEHGASQIEVTVNGLGPRAGNTALEQVAAVLSVAAARLGVSTPLKVDGLGELADLVALRSGIPIAQGQPVVGRHARARG